MKLRISDAHTMTPQRPFGTVSSKRYFGTPLCLVASILTLAGGLLIPRAEAQTFHVIHQFTGGADGGYPLAPFVADPDGNLYSTTYTGGDSFSRGVVFRLSPSYRETVLATNIGYPNGGLVRDAGGNLFGAEPDNGTGAGSVFVVTPRRNLITLHVMDYLTEGGDLYQGVLLDAAGNIYGTAYHGGIYSAGTVFKIDHSGFHVLYSFTGGTDGSNPEGTPVEDSAGNVYGTASGGGVQAGTVYKINSSGVFSVVHAFSGTDGYAPLAGLYMDASGTMYGTTEFGGTYGSGTIFKIDPDGTFTNLYNFTGGGDGRDPRGVLTRDSDGNFYGTTFGGGGPRGGGVVFEFDTTGLLTPLYQFRSKNDGANPVAGVYRDTAGNLFGTTFFGGVYGYGVAYQVTP